MGQIDRIEGLIDVQRLGWMFDEWMDTQFHTISASGDKIIVIDKKGTRTETNDLAAAAKAAKAEWDVTYKPQITSATSNANTATSNANTATTNANTAAQGATNVNAILSSTGGIVTITVTDRAGNTVTKEVGFRFAKVYPSYEAMQADFSGTDVNQGQFVLISSNVEDPHNAEFYVKNANAWGFMGDLSGAQGIKGDTPVLTALEDGTIYSDGTLLTDIIKTTNATVVSQENTRQQNEQTRQSNETARQQAEGQRASTFTTNEAQRQSDFETTQTSRDTTWTNWFSDSLSTGVRKLWNDFWAAINNSWDGFFGTSAEDANGVRKIWSTWYSATQTAWNGWFGTSSSEGVQKDWADLSSDAEYDHTRAGQDHTRAESDHTTAGTDHTTAQSDHTQAGNDHTQALSDTNRAAADHTTATTQTALMEAWNEHLPYVADGTQEHPGDANYWYTYDPSTEQYVKGPYAKGDNLDWASMTEQEKEDLVHRVLNALSFATVAEGQKAITELT